MLKNSNGADKGSRMKQESHRPPNRGRLLPAANAALKILLLFAACFCVVQTLGAQQHEPSTYCYMVFSNPVAGQEDVYNKWYDTQHAQDVVAVPGFVTAQRFVLSDTQLRVSKPLPKYLIMYKVVTDNLPSVYAEVRRRLDTGMTVIDPSFDRSSSVSLTYRVMGPTIYHKGPVRPSHPGSQVYYQLVFADPVSGREDEFNQWYDQQHAPDVVAALGSVSAQRYILSDAPLAKNQTATKYFVLYKIVTDDLASDLAEYRRLAPAMKMSPAFGESFGYTYKAIGPVIEGDKVRSDRAKHKNPH
jgi:hypothetical protein